MTTGTMTSSSVNTAAERFAAAVDRASGATTGDHGSAEWAAELGIVAMLRTTGARLATGDSGSKDRIRQRLLAERSGALHVDIRARQTTRQVSLDAR